MYSTHLACFDPDETVFINPRMNKRFVHLNMDRIYLGYNFVGFWCRSRVMVAGVFGGLSRLASIPTHKDSPINGTLKEESVR